MWIVFTASSWNITEPLTQCNCHHHLLPRQSKGSNKINQQRWWAVYPQAFIPFSYLQCQGVWGWRSDWLTGSKQEKLCEGRRQNKPFQMEQDSGLWIYLQAVKHLYLFAISQFGISSSTISSLFLLMILYSSSSLFHYFVTFHVPWTSCRQGD